ncbi:MAG: glycoside hydrolase family 3 C-terminal domain-containing protein [Faecalibacterium prausnitzii]|nr:glycoside hydrolase family 3 C-terminal domain-containing protein [Faecalibacterium prausnitzii]
MEIRYTSAAQWVAARDGVIPAPYALEAGESITDRYLEPVVFHNENGPDIGVTTCGVIVRDGLYFKDMDNSGELAPYKDWRLSPEERAKDMVAHLRLDQQAGLVLNTLFNTPVAPTRAEAAGADGKPEFGKIYKHHDPDEKPIPGPLPGMTMSIDDADVLDKHITAGVYRGDMRCEAGMVALYHNAGTQMLEYEACKGGVAIPYSLHTNPINIGYPDSLGIGAAVLGDGNADFVYEMADTDRKMMKAEGLHIMYGPQVDVATDPRWPRTNGTYGERTDVTSDITEALIKGYQNGDDGLNEGSVVLTVKHFPGDAPSENGFEPHVPIGQWRIYRTPGSMEKYHLPPFQRAFDHKASSIMPDYSRIAADGRAVPQTYRGEVTSTEAVPSAYSKELLTDLARNKMGFDGYINSDSGITSVQIYGVEDLTVPQRYAKAISAGTDVIGGNTDPENIIKAVEDGLLPKADLDRASYNRLLSLFRTKRVDNPYLDPDQADQARQDNFDGAKKKAYEANQKAVVLVKNHGGVLPLAKEKKVCIVTFKGVDSGFAKMAQAMGAGLGSANADEALRKTLAEAFEKKGYTVVATPEEADVLYLHVWPISNGVVFYQFAMPVIEMGEIVTDERETNKSQKKTGKQVTVTTLKDVEKIRELADAIHARGGKVVGTCVVNNPWLLDKLEPYCDALTIQYTVSTVALNNALNAQVDVISGDFAPTGKLSLTMVSDPAVIAITEQEIDGVVREICASSNDVPGYDKDPYIDPAILAGVRGGSYAYCDADGNYYRSGFGLNY